MEPRKNAAPLLCLQSRKPSGLAKLPFYRQADASANLRDRLNRIQSFRKPLDRVESNRRIDRLIQRSTDYLTQTEIFTPQRNQPRAIRGRAPDNPWPYSRASSPIHALHPHVAHARSGYAQHMTRHIQQTSWQQQHTWEAQGREAGEAMAGVAMPAVAYAKPTQQFCTPCHHCTLSSFEPKNITAHDRGKSYKRGLCRRCRILCT